MNSLIVKGKNLIKDFIKPIRYKIAEKYPTKVRVETSSVCQLRCPICPTTKGTTKKSIGYGFLSFRNFKELIKKNSSIREIELSNWGEMFLNPELDDIIKYAHEKKIGLTAENGVNLNTAKESTLKNLVKYKFKFLSVSIDGASDKTYRIYRRNGSFTKVISNIKKINYYKKKYHSNYPILQWQFILFGHNEHEFQKARKHAYKLNMKFKPKLKYSLSYSPLKKKNPAKKLFGSSDRKEFLEKYKKTYLQPCEQLWLSPQINWDGKLLGCCVNRWGDFGNVFSDGIKRSINNSKYSYAKKMILGEAPPRKDIPCYNCRYYSKNKYAYDKILRKKNQML